MTRLFIADPDAEHVARMRSALAAASIEIVGTAPSAEAALPDIVGLRPNALVVDDSACAGTPAEVVRRIASGLPDMCVLVTASAGTSPSLMGRAVAAGARGFLLKPHSGDELIELIRDAIGTSSAHPRAASPVRHGRLVSVYSPKGGAGATTVATNLAVAIAGIGSHRVGLVDLDLQFGDVGVALNLSGANSIVELLGQTVLSEDLMTDAFLRHPSGIRVLLAPEDLSAVENIEPGDVTRALEQLRAHFDIVLCDLWSMYEQLTREVLRMSDEIILVTTPELPALRDLRRVMLAGGDELRAVDRSTIVLNRASGKAGFSIAEVTKVLDREPAFTIPSDGVAITDAIDRGLSLLDARVRTKAARAFRDLAAHVVTPVRTAEAGGVRVARGIA